ncbi:MAG TPA: phosphate/phosphite/phosphonate ABC transporter substrate-binding protein [Magnetospirillum sp.]|nr:phosphate/phosphite/phosphonate ABC transporter substrate-binding protein [Magnetospirillum sp.]
MSRMLGMVAAVLVALGWAGLARAQAPSPAGEAFLVGVAPHTSARVIIEQYQPVRAALAQALGRPVEIVTAPDFTEFARRAVAQEYDVAVTTGHQAELLRADAGYAPLVTYKADFLAVLVVDRESPIKKPDGLNGTVVLGLNPSSLVTLWGLHWLRDKHVAPRQVRFVSAADSVAQLILAGDAAGGFMSLANFQKLPADVQDRLRIQESSQPMAGRVYMLNGRDAGLQAKVMAALKGFAASPEGLRYFSENKLDGYRDIGVAELKTMAPFADEVRQVLKGESR